ncbi:MAG: TAXI family TRAP transporter solute-binding subunit, partial [Actinomycetes bacterium]
MTSSSSVAPRRQPRLLLAVGVASSVLLAACGGGGEEEQAGGGAQETEVEQRNENLTFATGGTGGVYYPYGGGIANVISAELPGVVVTVQETNASVDNMKLLETDQAQMALALGDVVSDAVNGENTFTEPIDVCSLGNLYNN